MRRHAIALLSATALAVPFAGLPTTSASGAAAPQGATLARHLVTPLSVAVKTNGTVFVSQNFAGLLTRVKPGKAPKVVVAVKRGAELGALSAAEGEVTFAVTKTNGTTLVRRMAKDGSLRTLANLSDYEAANNPDGVTEYGAVGISDECAAQWPAELGPATYTGIVESHPYATAIDGDTTYVADAAANAIFAIDASGEVSTVAVLPGVPIEITQELADAAGVPDCAVGLDYVSEPVPTDVELGADALLHVTSLPGGPGEQLPAGSVLSVHPQSGHVETEVAGLSTPVGLAIDGAGNMYVAQLFAGSVVKVPAGTSTPEPYKSVPLPAALEVSGDSLYATVKALDEETGGRLVSWAL